MHAAPFTPQGILAQVWLLWNPHALRKQQLKGIQIPSRHLNCTEPCVSIIEILQSNTSVKLVLEKNHTLHIL